MYQISGSFCRPEVEVKQQSRGNRGLLLKNLWIFGRILSNSEM